MSGTAGGVPRNEAGGRSGKSMSQQADASFGILEGCRII